jgi:hypothetical protein
MTRRIHSEQRPVFTLRIAGKPGTAGIHALKFLLKRLLRQHGFVALDVREETEPEPITYTQAFTQLRHDVARRAARIRRTPTTRTQHHD